MMDHPSVSHEFYIWCPSIGEDESDARLFSEVDTYTAVIKWAENFDLRHGSDAAIINGTPREVYVKHGERLFWFIVHGELVANYQPQFISEAK